MHTCRSLSLTDLLEEEKQHPSPRLGSPRVASNEAMAAAEAATASALHSGQQGSAVSSSTHTDPSRAADAGAADEDGSPAAVSFGSPFDTGLHESTSLLRMAEHQSDQPPLDDGVQHAADQQVHTRTD